jgi:outer membrane lipoprotein SlyB
VRRAAFAVLCGVVGLVLSGCQQSGQSRYSYQEVGRSTVIEFGTVLSVRPIDITGQNTGTGALAGAAGGGVAGSAIGRGVGNAGAIVGGVLIGAAVGALVEQGLADRSGLEYTIVLANGKTITIPQEHKKEDRVFNSGERVMVQASGIYQRVLPADNIPTEIARPKDLKVKD